MEKCDGNKIRVVLVDDHPATIAGIKECLESLGLEIVGTAENGDEAIELCSTKQPDVLLLDIGMPGKDGFDVVDYLKSINSKIKILIFSAHDSDEYIFRMIEAGVNGYALKKEPIDIIGTAILSVYNDKIWFSSPITERIIAKALHRSNHPEEAASEFTPRENQIVALICQGKTDHEIGIELHISERTVRYHIVNVYNKVGVNGRVELVVWAISHGIVDIPNVDK